MRTALVYRCLDNGLTILSLAAIGVGAVAVATPIQLDEGSHGRYAQLLLVVVIVWIVAYPLHRVARSGDRHIKVDEPKMWKWISVRERMIAAGAIALVMGGYRYLRAAMVHSMPALSDDWFLLMELLIVWPFLWIALFGVFLWQRSFYARHANVIPLLQLL